MSRAECRSREMGLINCTINKTGINGCDHSEDAGVICMGRMYVQLFRHTINITIKAGPSSCVYGDVILNGGKNDREGRVEICYNGVWGTVCADNGWDEVDANVVCQQLGFRYQGAMTSNSRFGAGEGPILLENVRCNQSHSTLSQCVDLRLIGGLISDCECTAGVICVGEDMMSTSTELIPITTLHVTTINLPHDSTYKLNDTTSTTSKGLDSSTIAECWVHFLS